MTIHQARRVRAILLFLVFVAAVRICPAYSVLTHEQVIDLLWRDQIQPLLLKRFPQSSEEDLRKAHAFAYGGSVVQDMGYYPFGSKDFSDLVHYVRTGDFVHALIDDSCDVYEYAFALGALAHYSSDNQGHPTINHVVAIGFPKLEKKYGKQVTYADNPKAHIQTEFGFDMEQVAKNRYTSDQYHDFIGFEISKPLLDRAFQDTYSLRLEDVFGDVDLAIGTFRRSISKVIPEMTRVALLSRKKELVRDTPNFNEKKFRYYLSRAQYNKEWGSVYRRPGLGTRILAFFLKIIPKVGPFKAVAFKTPTTQTEDLYIKSVNQTVENYRYLLRQSTDPHFSLPDTDCDTGRPTRPGEYRLADRSYAKLLLKLQEHGFQRVSPELRQNILAFYADPNSPIEVKKDKKKWKEVTAALEKLKSVQVPAPQPAAD
ncbi:MAG TPA: zinc dependent phospholipase C family protein [Terriglobales bacterium]|nr:zinc dependent phospholipase C family protein [Terriglobales bacterium]